MDILTIHNLDKIEAIYLAQGWAIVEKDTAFLQFEKLDRGTQFRCFIVKKDDDETLNVSHVIGNIAFNGDCSTIGFNTQLADIEYQRRILVNKDFLQTCKKVAIGYVPTFYYERPRICVRCNIERSLPNPKISYCQPCIQDIADNLFK